MDACLWRSKDDKKWHKKWHKFYIGDKKMNKNSQLTSRASVSKGYERDQKAGKLKGGLCPN